MDVEMDMDICGNEINNSVENQLDTLQYIQSESESNSVQTSKPNNQIQNEQIPQNKTTHIESLQIPHLQIFQRENKPKDDSEDECNLSAYKVLEKQEPEDYFDDAELSDEILQGVEVLPEEGDDDDNLDESVTDIEENDNTCNKSTEKTQIVTELVESEFSTQSTPLTTENLKTNLHYCTNCKTLLSEESSKSKNFHEFLPSQYLDVSTGGYTDVQIVDAVSEIFKIQWTCRDYGEIYKRDDLALCLECASTLAHLYRLYNEFASLAIKSKSFLSAIINFQKDLNLDDRGDGLSSADDETILPNNIVSTDDEETTVTNCATWKRSRPIKKIKRYGDNDENLCVNKESDSDNRVSYSLLRKTRKSKSLSEVTPKIDHVLSHHSIPPKKRNKTQTLTEIELFEEPTTPGFTTGITKFELDDSFAVTETETHQMEDVLEAEDNEPLHLRIQRLTTFPFPKDDEDQQKPLKCKQCNKEFKFPIQYRLHMNSKFHRDKFKLSRLNHEDFSSQEGTKNRKKKLGKKGNSSRRLSKNSKSCPDCGESFTSLKELRRHSNSHRSKKIAGECDRCHKKFKTLGGLKIHYAAHVRDDNKYSCKECNKRFRKVEALELHEKTDHEGFKPHQCPQCSKKFRLKDKLKLHMMVIHENRKPFPCCKCEKSFRTKYHLKIHDVSQHIQGGDTTIGCSQCKRKFPDREALEKHVTVHEQEKPFICSSCNKGFHTSARLKLHEKSHQEVPSCLCPICGRAYKHIRDLRLHEVVHQDESTYRFGCGDCPRRFYRIDLLRVHQSNEKHFASEAIGPTVSKSQPNKDNSYFHVKDQGLEEDEEDDENETDSEILPLPPPKPKKKRKVIARERPRVQQRELSQQVREREMTVMHPHATVIYHPSTVVQLHLDQSNVPVSNANSASSVNISNNLSMSAHHQRHVHHDVQTASANYFMNQRERQNIAHHSGIQIQSIPSAAHSHIQFGNQTIYANPINMSNVNSTSEQIGFDIITSFINNLG